MRKQSQDVLRTVLITYALLASFPLEADDPNCNCERDNNASVRTLAAAIAPVQDSFTQECPRDRRYPDLFANMDFAEIKSSITQSLAAMGLEAKINEFRDTPEDLIRLKRLANITLPALRLYPREFFTRVGLKYIVLTKDLRVANQLRKAMPEPSTGSLHYSDNNDLNCEAGMESRVHHEFYHFIEGKIKGNMYFADPAWARMNARNFRYGSGGATAYGPNGFQNLGHPGNGFISAYARYGLEEDKAEVFAWMMTRGFAERTTAWEQADPVLARKMNYIRNFIRGLNPSMDARYFARLRGSPN